MLESLVEGGSAGDARRDRWPSVRVDAARWRGIGEALRAGQLDLLGEWGEPAAVQCALYEPSAARGCIAWIEASLGGVPALAALHPPASRPERAIADLFGLELTGHPDPRPWLDHGCWPGRLPLAAGERPRPANEDYGFLAAQGPSLHQIPVGPVHAGIIEPGHFRFSASGETVVRLEERLGYVHRGIEMLMQSQPIEAAARLAARVSGDSTVAYSFAFARAIEEALDFAAPPRGQRLRGLMAELERLANHLGDIGAICNDASFTILHAECAILREQTLRTAARAFGHRLMMDRIVPGGVLTDLDSDGREAILAHVRRLRAQLPELIELYDSTASLQDRTVGTGTLSAALAAQYAAGGYIGRASGRAFDARTVMPYAPYDVLPIKIIVREEGDVNARVWVRILELEESLRWLEAAVDSLPRGAIRVPVPAASGSAEALTLVEGFRGDVLVYLRLAPSGRIERCHARDPSCFQWPLLEAAIGGNIVADFPLCNKSFNCSYAGHDL